MRENKEIDDDLEISYERNQSDNLGDEEEFFETDSLLESSTDMNKNVHNDEDINVWLILGRMIIGGLIFYFSIKNFHTYVLDDRLQIISAADNEMELRLYLLAGILLFALINAIAVFSITISELYVTILNNFINLGAFICVFIPGFQLNFIIALIICFVVLYLNMMPLPYRNTLSTAVVIIGALALPSEYALTWNLFLTIFIVNLIYAFFYKLRNRFID